jgi:hypothetical protein
VKRRDQIDEILAGGHLPARTYDDIFERVLDATSDRRRQRKRSWTVVPTAAFAMAVALWLVFIGPTVDRFTAKGPDRAPTATGIDIACVSSAGPRCRTNDTLTFIVSPSASAGYLGAYAQRADDPGGERLWYFPDATGRAPLVVPAAATTVLPDGVRLGPEHRPGRYRVTVWLSPQPIERRSLERPPATARLATSMEIEVAP